MPVLKLTVNAMHISEQITNTCKMISYYYCCSVCAQNFPARNTIDVMHTENNVAENVLKTMFGEKDTPNVRLDLENRNICHHLWLRRMGSDCSRAYMPDATYVLRAAKTCFCGR